MRNPPDHLRPALVLLLAAVVGSSRGAADTVYTANETTATVSVIDTITNSVIATIGLGSDPAIPGTPQPNGPFNGETDHHLPFYNGHIGTHGLWIEPRSGVLLVANRISGTIVAIDTGSNLVLGYLPVGREPHLATIRPGGQEAWVSVRGENYIEVIELNPVALFDAARHRTERMTSVAKIATVLGPSMVAFNSAGTFAFVAAGKQAAVHKIDATTRQIVATQTLPAAFTPFGLVTPNDAELYLIHKGAGLLSILRTTTLAPVVSGLPIGPRANHVFFAGRFAYITIGGPAPTASNPDPEGKIVIFDRARRKIARELVGSDWTGEPHGIWGTSDGRLYIGHERGNRVTVLNTGNPNDAFDDVIAGTVGGTATQLRFMRGIIDIVAKP